MPTPKITVVTPVRNQAQYIEATIQSVLDQGIEGLEYIIMDGGSTDGTQDIIRKYERHLAHWESGPDGGQTQGISKGFKRATGEILCWINGDDEYEPHALKSALAVFEASPEAQLVYGDCTILTQDGRKVPKIKISFDLDIYLFAYGMIPQPSSFWRRTLYLELGGLNPKYQYCFDYDFYLRAGMHLRGRIGAIRHIHDMWSIYRLHGESKSVAEVDRFGVEFRQIREQYPEYRNCKFKNLAARYQLFRALMLYYRERGMVPTRKDTSKA